MRRDESRLLVVDDNPLNRQRLGERLRGQGYQVETASSGLEALDNLRRSRVDLVLLDSMMPELSGLEVLRRMKADPENAKIPVIMVSGVDGTENVAACIELGAEDFISSPFDPLLLAARIDASLENLQLREQESRFLAQLKKEKEHSERLVNIVIPVGISLMQEPDYDLMLEKILIEAQNLGCSDGGSLYLREGGQQLRFVMFRNTALTGQKNAMNAPVPLPKLPLYDPATGQPNHANVACHVALTEQSVNIPDVYNSDGFDFRGTRAFDRKTGYRSVSMLAVPLKDRHSTVIGVLQLINARDPETREIRAFDHTTQQSIESLSLLVSAALQSYERIHREDEPNTAVVTRRGTRTSQEKNRP